MTGDDVLEQEAQAAENFVGWGKRQVDFVIQKPVSLEGDSVVQWVVEDSVVLEQVTGPCCLILGLVADLAIPG